MNAEQIAKEIEKLQQEREDLHEEHSKGHLTRRDLMPQLRRIEESIEKFLRRAERLLKKIADVDTEYC